MKKCLAKMAEKDKKSKVTKEISFSLIECELNKRSIFDLKSDSIKKNPHLHDSGKINIKKREDDADKIWIYDNGKLI